MRRLIESERRVTKFNLVCDCLRRMREVEWRIKKEKLQKQAWTVAICVDIHCNIMLKLIQAVDGASIETEKVFIFQAEN